MNIFVETIKKDPDFIGSNGRSEEKILRAEATLGVHFAEDYHAYLKEIGLASFDGRELTGLTEDVRLDVVCVTKEQRKRVAQVPAGWYVIEEANIDGIVVWQDSDGTVYATQPKRKSQKIADSLLEYIS